MYSYTIEKDKVKIIEGTEDELRKSNLEVFETKAKAQARGNNVLFRQLKKEWNQTKDFTTERVVELERLMYRDLPDHTEDYSENMYVIQKLEEQLSVTADVERKEIIRQRIEELR